MARKACLDISRRAVGIGGRIYPCRAYIGPVEHVPYRHVSCDCKSRPCYRYRSDSSCQMCDRPGRNSDDIPVIGEVFPHSLQLQFSPYSCQIRTRMARPSSMRR